jgi:prolyl 4-hydroxylase
MCALHLSFVRLRRATRPPEKREVGIIGTRVLRRTSHERSQRRRHIEPAKYRAMTITVALSTGLRNWITDNLQRGNSPDAMIETLVVSQKFEPRIARGLVDAFVSARAAGTPPPEHTVKLDTPAPEYQYETPRIAAGNVIRAVDAEIRVLQRLERPIIVLLEGVLSAAECSELIELARPRLQRSTVVDPRTGTNTVADYRNSEGMFFRLGETALVARLDERISALMNCPVENGEGLQVLRYGTGGHTAPHFDFKIPSNATNSESIARSGQRLSTLIIYLNDVAQGGETVFPVVGLSVTPRRGNGVYFEYTNSHMQVDQRSLHAGAPVAQGEKWVVTKWMRTRRFRSVGAE